MWLGREGVRRMVERKWRGGSRGDGADVFVKDRAASAWILSVSVREYSDLSRRVTIATCRLAACHAAVATLLRGRGNVVTAAWQRCYGGVATLLRGRGNVVMGPWQRCYGAVATDELPYRNANVPRENGFVPVEDGRKGLGLSGIGCFLGRALMLSVFVLPTCGQRLVGWRKSGVKAACTRVGWVLGLRGVQAAGHMQQRLP